MIAFAFSAARATDFIVTTSLDRDGTCLSNNNCSLREAVKAANAAGGQNNIYFPQFLDGQVFELTLGELVFHNGTLNIQGSSPYFVHIRGAGSRIFSVVNAARLELRGLKLTNGNGGGALNSGKGGAILAEDNRNCRLLLDGVMVSGNSGTFGGGINAETATTTITNSIISGNTATGFGGGLNVSGTVTIENSSIVTNRSTNSLGGGVSMRAGTAALRNVTVSDNRANDVGGIYYFPSLGSDRLNLEYVTVSNNVSDDSRSGGLHCNGTGASAQMSIFYGNTNRFGSGTNPNVDSFCGLGGTNQIGPNSPNPNFGPLTFDGVHPHYRPLLAGSGAIDAGAATGFPATDIRGAGRATDGNGDGQFISDLGAYEAPSKVTNTSDDAAAGGSLRRMVAGNPPNSEIIFDPNFFNVPRTIQVSGSQLSIDKNLTIIGPGANLLTIQPLVQSAAIFISSGKSLNLYDVKLAGGSNRPIYNGGTFGAGGITISGNQLGAMYNAPGAYAVLSYSTISGNTSTTGGGIFNDGALYLVNSTISGNHSSGGGGGVYNNSGTAYFVNSTVSGNTSSDKGAGVYNAANASARFINSTITNNQSFSSAGAGVWNENFSGGNTVRARNSIIAANISGNGNPVDYVGDLNNLGNNIINNANPGLAPLGFYGGITQIHPLLPGSAALNAGNNCVLADNGCGDGEWALSYDQRGGSAPRKIGAAVDIGAFERSVTLDQTGLPNGETTVLYNQQLSATRQTSFRDLLSVKSDDNLLEKSDDKLLETSFAPFTFSIVPIAGQSLPPGLSLAASGALSGTPTQAGTFTFTVKAADSDGIASAARYSVTIAAFNNPPTVAGATISRQAGSPVAGATIATVGDAETGANGLSVSIASANPSNGVTVSSVVNTNGNVAGNVVAGCSATNAAFTVRASDGVKTADGTLTVNVSANSAPTLVYPNAPTVSVNNSLNISPTAASDNGSISSFSIQSVSPALAAAPTINAATGVVSVTNANPGGTFTITVRATDNCGATRDASFTLNVTIPTKTVTKIADTDDGVCDTDCSLREAIAAADSGDAIEFAAPLFDTRQTITLDPAFGNLYIPDKNLTINGRGARLTVISGGNQSRVLNIYNSIVTLNGLTFTNGREPNAVGGGGIYNNGRLTVNNCLISGNTTVGANGGGINNRFVLTINNSTISGNSATSATEGGGGIYTHSLTQVVINNSTISGNSAAWGGGGIYTNQANLKINNSTITANSAASAGGIWDYITDKYIQNSIISGNFAPSFPDLRISGTPFFMNNSNLIGVDAKLAPLGFYGGATPTHALLPNSPAINAGNNCVLTANACASFNPALTTDQRGAATPRKIDANVDIGAFERNITLEPATLPTGNYNFNYAQQLSAARQMNVAESGDDSSEYSLSIAPQLFEIVPVAGQNLPPGITLSPGGLLAGTPTAAGIYDFTVKVVDADGSAGVQLYALQIVAPTSANVAISGRVLSAAGGVRDARVILTDSLGNARTVSTNNFGNYRFEQVEVGETYVVTVVLKRETVAARIVSVADEIGDLDFTVIQ